MTLSRYTAEAEFQVPLGLLRAEGYHLDSGPLILDIEDEEVIVTMGDLGVLVCAGVLSPTYTYAMRDAVCLAQSAIAGLLGVPGTEVAQPFRVNVTHTDGLLGAMTDEQLNERRA